MPTATAIPTHEARAEAGESRGGFALATATLWRREMVRFFRSRHRVLGALATPVLFWLLLGSGLDRVFDPGVAAPGVGAATDAAGPAGMGYLRYFFPGTVVMVLLFSAIFSTISLIEDRRDGFLQGVLVAPVSRLAIVLGKVLGGATVATAQAALLLLAWPWIGGGGEAASLVLAAGVMAVLAVGLTALGFSLAWVMESSAAFHGVMNLVLLPMWLLSGAVFPVETAPPWLAWTMRLNPLTYGYAAVASLMHGAADAARAAVWPGLGPALLATALLTAAALAVAVRVCTRARLPEA